uniref:RNA-directed DNA polymerase, eukaryota n=1 Tax=Tanacetum cinerariifolium TaxID=118510 RepID=A0A6L2K5N1_TANCI|nr:RNA-directed DNA polymerase, eukaryota [Tanacetum cinerariifolium]
MDSHPVKPFCASIIHSKSKPTRKSSLPVNVHTITLNGHDLINDEDSPTVILLKSKDVDSMINMYTICLINLPIGGRLYTRMNKAYTKLSKLDRFLIYEEVLEALPNIRITALGRLWSDHNPFLLYVSKSDFGLTPFKIYNLWQLRDSFDEVIKMDWSTW